MATDFTSQINAIYQAVQYRTGPTADVTVYNASLQSGALTLAQVQAAVISDPYTVNNVNPVIREYQAAFGRVPDQAGAAFWVGQVAANPTAALAALGTTFANSAEFNARFGANATTVATPSVVTALYTNVLGRTPDAAGLAFWQASGLTAAQLLNAFAGSPEFVANAAPSVTTFQQAEIAGNAPTTGSLFGTGGIVVPGSNFTLTTGVDNISGTAGNDTVIADNTDATKKQLSVADTINGGAGTDTLKVFLDTAATTVPTATLSSIETLVLNGGVITAFDASVSAFTGVTSLVIDSAIQPAATTYTLGKGQSISLANLAPGQATTTTIALAATNTDATAGVTLNNVVTGTTTTWLNTLDFSSAKTTAVNIATTGAASTVSLTNTGAAITKLVISGDQKLSLTEDAATSAAIVTIDASANNAGVSVNTKAGTVGGAFKFTGGAGNDTVTFANDALGTIISGAQLDGGAGTGDKIGLFDTALSAAETAAINAAKGFEVIGLNANITVDASTLATYKAYSIDTAALTVVENNLATATTTTIAKGATAVTVAGAVGVIDTAIVLGSSTAAGATTASLTTTGLTNVALTSNGTSGNTITALHNSDNSVFTIKGAADLTVTGVDGTAVASKFDASAFTGKLTINGSNLTGSGDIIIGGTGADTINGGKGADTMTGGAGADTFSFTSTAAATASGATFGQADVITDFVIGTDKLQFAGVTDVVSAQQTAVAAAVTALAAGSTDAQIATAMATANTTNLGVSFATFGGNTYVLYETTGASTGVAADDVFIKLTGLTTLPTFASDVIA